MSVTVATIMDRAAALLNDVSRSVYSYTTQLPYIQIAYDELKVRFEEENVPITNALSSALTVPVGTTTISATSTPALPSDLIMPLSLHERLSGSSDDYVPMSQKDFLPDTAIQTDSLVWWTYQNQEIRLIGATSARQVKIHYSADSFTTLAGTSTQLTTINCTNFLARRTAALLAEFVEENPQKAGSLNGLAGMDLEQLINMAAKSKQGIITRRRPFMSGYKTRGRW